ncbi:response regulator [Deinococcus sonorensis]|uniref:Response regulator n=2 Tax=Deinococcus sonorensis TaxID=309891 RepID=A0AAU7U7G9_9DEIO
MTLQAAHILLVEDDPGDVMLTREAFKQTEMVSEISVAADGIEALEFLRGQGDHPAAQRPDLILLDLNMPRMNGLDFLSALKGDSELKRIPVVVFSTSTADADVVASYDRYANSYISKPVHYHEYSDVVKSVEEFWLRIAKLPQD